MKKQILASWIALLGVGVLALFLVRAERIIQRQQQALHGLSGKVERLEHGSASAPSSAAPDNTLRAEVDRLRHSVADLQDQLNKVQNQANLAVEREARLQEMNRIDPLASRFKGRDGRLEAPPGPNGAAVRPFSPVPSQAPPGWIPFEFNGMTYYRIPLALNK